MGSIQLLSSDGVKPQSNASKIPDQDDYDLLRDTDIDLSVISIDKDDTNKRAIGAQIFGVNVGDNFDIDAGELNMGMRGNDETPDNISAKGKMQASQYLTIVLIPMVVSTGDTYISDINLFYFPFTGNH